MSFYALATLHRKLSFPLRLPSVNVTKSAVSFTEEILNEKLCYLCSVTFSVM